MYIENINIKNLRILKNLQFAPSKHINLITGSNGSGKSSLLESIYLLARSRSFRTNNYINLINKDEKEIIISANLIKDSDQKIKIGLKKSSNNTELYIAGHKQKKVSHQARLIPLGIITTNSQKLLNEGPKTKRKFLNWGVFHVEHTYSDLMIKYNKILIQRNSALRTKDRGYRAWDNQLIKYGKEITTLRKKYLNYFEFEMNKLLKGYEAFKNIRIIYKQGWKSEKSLEDVIFESDETLLRYTLYGPHRADLGIYIEDKSVQEILSSGQLKLLSILLIIAQLKLINKYLGEAPILLFDDFQSELDNYNQQLLIQTIKELDIQMFITSIDFNLFFEDGFKGELFHVEHGEIY